MRKEVREFLESKGVVVALKGYKEMLGTDGYHMIGSIYVNGKRALLCEDEGRGGELYIDVLNKDYAKPLLDLKEELGSKFKAYPESETIGDLPYTINNIFYTLAEEFLMKRDLKKTARKHAMVKFKNEEYEKDVYTRYTNPMSHSLLKYPTLGSSCTKNVAIPTNS